MCRMISIDEYRWLKQEYRSIKWQMEKNIVDVELMNKSTMGKGNVENYTNCGRLHNLIKSVMIVNSQDFDEIPLQQGVLRSS